MINKSTVSEVFIGLREDVNNFERFSNWSSGHILYYTNWYESPTESASNGAACVAKNKEVHGKWNILSCLQSLPYICKKKGMTVVVKTRSSANAH